jgi:hypothetical protein
MVIKASAAADIRQLIVALGADDEVRREAAIARLAVIGARAVDRLIAAYESTGDRDMKIAVLRALESVGDRRTVAVAREALTAGGDLGVAAAFALRGLLDSAHGSTGTDALDALVAAVLDPAAERRVRLASFEALQDMPAGVRARVAAALQAEPDAGLKARALDTPRDAAAADAVWQDALDGRLPDAAAVLREAARTRAQAAALSALQKLIDAIRAREGSVRAHAKRAEWQALRGALHQALALRGSRVAVYDLRETIEGARGPLPVSFLAALHVVGDASCLEPLAAAYARTGIANARWRHQLGEAFLAIARREKVTRRHATMKRIASRWPDAARDLAARGPR